MVDRAGGGKGVKEAAVFSYLKYTGKHLPPPL